MPSAKVSAAGSDRHPIYVRPRYGIPLASAIAIITGILFYAIQITVTGDPQVHFNLYYNNFTFNLH
jgi:hypothetical protein